MGAASAATPDFSAIAMSLSSELTPRRGPILDMVGMVNLVVFGEENVDLHDPETLCLTAEHRETPAPAFRPTRRER